MSKYRYVFVHRDAVNLTLTEYASNGWTVHTFNRNRNAEFIDILFEYEYGPVYGSTGPR